MTQSPEFAEIGRLLPMQVQDKEQALDELIGLVNLAMASGRVRGDEELFLSLTHLPLALRAFRQGLRLIVELARDHNVVVNETLPPDQRVGYAVDLSIIKNRGLAPRFNSSVRKSSGVAVVSMRAFGSREN